MLVLSKLRNSRWNRADTLSRTLLRLFTLLPAVGLCSAAAARCPAFTELASARLQPPAIVTPQANPQHHGEWVYQEFPQKGLARVDAVSAWAVRVVQHSTTGDGENMVPAIAEAFYITSEGKPIRVLEGLWPQQIIVPYARSLDVAHDLWDDSPLLSPTEAEAGLAPCGEVGPAIYPRNEAAADYDLAPDGSRRPIYIKEIRDLGPVNASFNGDDEPPRPPIMRRGAELVIWGVSDTDNYDNVIAYHFRDDGEILALLGPTGWNTRLGPPDRVQSGNTPHAHTTLWRLQPRIAGEATDDVATVAYDQHAASHSGRTEHEAVTPVRTETALSFDPVAFTSVGFSDPASFNEAAPGKPPQENAYVLTLISDGAPRHRLWEGDDGSSDRFDIAVVRDRDVEKTAQPFPTDDASTVTELLADAEPVVGEPVAVYAYSSVVHLPRAEDFVVHPGAPDYRENAWRNRTAIRWSGIRLTPRNIYTRVPFSQPTPGAAPGAGFAPPLTQACLVEQEPVTATRGACRDGRPAYSITLRPANRNPFGKAASALSVSGAALEGSPVSVAASIPFGDAIPLPAGGLVVRPKAGEQEICLDLALSGNDWRCPVERRCFAVPDAACP